MAHPPLNELHQGLSYEEYASYEGLRSSDLKLLKRSPAHWYARNQVKREKSDALEFGALFHLAIENQEKFRDTCVIEPTFEGLTKDGKVSTRSAEAKAKKEQWHIEQVNQKRTIVRSDWWEPLIGMLTSCSNHKLVSHLLKDGVRETSLWVQDDETGEILKARPDFISAKGYIVDIKTTRDATYPTFYNDIFGSRGHDSPFYVLQAAHYAHCARLSKVAKGDRFFFVAIEKDPPYGIKTWTMDEGCLDPGEQWRRNLTKLYKTCKTLGKWACYDEAAEQILPPQWVETPDMDMVWK